MGKFPVNPVQIRLEGPIVLANARTVDVEVQKKRNNEKITRKDKSGLSAP